MVEAVEKDALQDALKQGPRQPRGGGAPAPHHAAGILNYKVRNYGIDWHRFQ